MKTGKRETYFVIFTLVTGKEMSSDLCEIRYKSTKGK